MRKKYLALLLACMMTVPCFLTSCGRIADEIVQEDEDDKEDKDDDEDEEEEPVYIDVIDEDELEDQLEVIIDNSSDWLVDDGNSAAIDEVGYCVTDLDHNGRAEILSVIRFEYGDTYEIHVYEVDEKGKSLKEAKWKFKGLDKTPDKYPDFDAENVAVSYYDKKENETHYLINNFFDNGNMELGTVYCDLMYADGKVTCRNYAAIIHAGDYEYCFDDGTEVSDDDEFLQHLIDYPKKGNPEDAPFGLFSRSYSDLDSFAEMDDDEWEEILTASYHVFIGETDWDIFDETYNSSISQVSEGILYEDLVGRWILYSSDDGENLDYYDEYEDYISLVFYLDYESLFSLYFDGATYWEQYLTVDVSGDYPTMELHDQDHEYLQDSADYVSFTVIDMDDDGQEIEIYYVVLDDEGNELETYDLVFRKDNSFTFSDADMIDRIVGEWGIYSSELEGEITYYDEDDYRYFTLSVSEDHVATFKEYEDGKVYLEFEGDIETDPAGTTYFEYSDPDALNDVVAYEVYTFDEISDDGNTLVVSLDFYGQGGDWLGYTVLTFNRI